MAPKHHDWPAHADLRSPSPSPPPSPHKEIQRPQPSHDAGNMNMEEEEVDSKRELVPITEGGISNYYPHPPLGPSTLQRHTSTSSFFNGFTTHSHPNLPQISQCVDFNRSSIRIDSFAANYTQLMPEALWYKEIRLEDLLDSTFYNNLPSEVKRKAQEQLSGKCWYRPVAATRQLQAWSLNEKNRTKFFLRLSPAVNSASDDPVTQLLLGFLSFLSANTVWPKDIRLDDLKGSYIYRYLSSKHKRKAYKQIAGKCWYQSVAAPLELHARSIDASANTRNPTTFFLRLPPGVDLEPLSPVNLVVLGFLYTMDLSLPDQVRLNPANSTSGRNSSQAARMLPPADQGYSDSRQPSQTNHSINSLQIHGGQTSVVSRPSLGSAGSVRSFSSLNLRVEIAASTPEQLALKPCLPQLDSMAKKRGRPFATAESAQAAMAKRARKIIWVNGDNIKEKKKKVGRPTKSKKHVETPTPEPKYPVFVCEWEGCFAELHNAETLRSHLRVVHGTKESGKITCRWKQCFMSNEVVDVGTGNVVEVREELVFHSKDVWEKHVEETHIRNVLSWQGDGPKVADGMARNGEKESLYETDTWLFDANAKQVTPSVKDQKIHNDSLKGAAAKRYKKKKKGPDDVYDVIEEDRRFKKTMGGGDDMKLD